MIALVTVNYHVMYIYIYRHIIYIYIYIYIIIHIHACSAYSKIGHLVNVNPESLMTFWTTCRQSTGSKDNTLHIHHFWHTWFDCFPFSATTNILFTFLALGSSSPHIFSGSSSTSQKLWDHCFRHGNSENKSLV